MSDEHELTQGGRTTWCALLTSNLNPDLRLWFRSDLTCGRSVDLLDHGQTFGFPVSNPAELAGVVPGIGKFLSGTRRAPSAVSVEHQFDILRDVLHPGVQFADGNVDGAFYRAVLFEFAVLADIDQ